MQVDKYLERVGMERPAKADLAALTALHRAHLFSIPYENLDVQLGRKVTIDIPAIYEKIVERGRGGWCYEMNGIFGWALEELGFRVRRATGAVMRELAGEVVVGNHLVLRVEMDDGLYLGDVGFGDGPLDPIRIVQAKFSANGFTFGLERIDENWWRLQNHPRGGAKSFDFNLAPADEARFAAMCDWLQSAPESVFVQNAVCQRHTPKGLSILRGRTLRHISGAETSDTLLGSADELLSVLRGEFFLDLPEARSLWPKICARHEQLVRQPASA